MLTRDPGFEATEGVEAAGARAVLRALQHNDRAQVVVLARGLLTSGVSLAGCVEGVLAPVMRTVGQRWQSTEWSVAQEHAATAAVDGALSALAAVDIPHQARGRVVVACPEGEWHSLAARMVSEVLAHAGFQTITLGASTPTDQLADFLLAVQPVALAVACTLPRTVTAVLDMVIEAHRVGIPVLAGGAGLGPDGVLAGTLGADGWAATAYGGSQVIASWAAGGPPDRQQSTAEPGRAEPLVTHRRAIVAAAVDALPRHTGLPLVKGDRQLSLVRAGVADLVDVTAAALLTGSTELLVRQLRWRADMLHARGVSPAEIFGAVPAITEACAPHSGAAGELLTAAAATVNARGPLLAPAPRGGQIQPLRRKPR